MTESTDDNVLLGRFPTEPETDEATPGDGTSESVETPAQAFRIESLSKRVDDLRDDMNRGFDGLHRDLKALSDKVDGNLRWTIGLGASMWLTTIALIVGLYFK